MSHIPTLTFASRRRAPLISAPAHHSSHLSPLFAFSSHSASATARSMDSTAARTSTTATAAGFDANRRDADVSKAAARRSASAPAANRRSAVSDTLRAAANASASATFASHVARADADFVTDAVFATSAIFEEREGHASAAASSAYSRYLRDCSRRASFASARRRRAMDDGGSFAAAATAAAASRSASSTRLAVSLGVGGRSGARVGGGRFGDGESVGEARGVRAPIVQGGLRRAKARATAREFALGDGDAHLVANARGGIRRVGVVDGVRIDAAVALEHGDERGVLAGETRGATLGVVARGFCGARARSRHSRSAGWADGSAAAGAAGTSSPGRRPRTKSRGRGARRRGRS